MLSIKEAGVEAYIETFHNFSVLIHITYDVHCSCVCVCVCVCVFGVEQIVLS